MLPPRVDPVEDLAQVSVQTGEEVLWYWDLSRYFVKSACSLTLNGAVNSSWSLLDTWSTEGLTLSVSSLTPSQFS